MSNAENKKVTPEDPREAEPGRGAPGDAHSAVQMAQTTEVNAPDEEIPSGADVEHNKDQLEAFRKEEEGSGTDTTGKKDSGGFSVDEDGNLNVVAVEPEMYYE